jgi:ADP-ribosyl-[dinitrogen reductase] hydrolase
MPPKTSVSHPLQIAEAQAPGGGVVGVTFCPGKTQDSAFSGSWARDLGLDLDGVRAWGAEAVVTLVTHAELVALRVDGIGQEVAQRHMAWLHLPIEDVTAPTTDWEAQWDGERATLHAILDRKGRVLVHCKGGLGRAGTVAALLLTERGMPAAKAIAEVRRVRPGALETRAQEDFVRRERRPWTA